MKSRSDVELLAELEKDLAELQTTISVLKRRMGVPAMDAGVTPQRTTGATAVHGDGDKPFLGMSILDATKKYLQRVKEPRSPQDIAEALQAGGVHSRSDDFPGIIRTTLSKKGKDVGVESFGQGKWGLGSWRPSRGKSPSAEDDANGG